MLKLIGLSQFGLRLYRMNGLTIAEVADGVCGEQVVENSLKVPLHKNIHINKKRIKFTGQYRF
ncbi:hypothetical protein FACHB389_34410 [Nostoc calcicola FACHB-389]|nr:hypothetical protein FACHB389_34410 [Nostoc calcicola FACHB-389]